MACSALTVRLLPAYAEEGHVLDQFMSVPQLAAPELADPERRGTVTGEEEDEPARRVEADRKCRSPGHHRVLHVGGSTADRHALNDGDDLGKGPDKECALARARPRPDR